MMGVWRITGSLTVPATFRVHYREVVFNGAESGNLL